jgi:amidase
MLSLASGNAHRIGRLLLLAAALHPARLSGQTFDVFEASVADIQAALTDGRVTSVQLVDAYLARIAAYDKAGPRLNTMIRLNPAARVEAETLDRERLANGPRGPLHGIPVLLKDNYDLQGLPTTAGSVALANNIPFDDAFQVRKLKEAGAIVLGKTNLHELASGITTISSVGGQTLNPYDPSRNPGGSSGGTGAAIAASFAALGWGTDTCGSIRIPSSHNNLFGLRPTKGLSSIAGIVPLSHTQDVGGPLARSVRDLAIGLDATVGFDPNDPATSPMQQNPPPHFAGALDTAALRGARIGILENLFAAEADDQEASAIVRAAIDQLKAAGASVVDVEIEDLDSLIAGAGVIDHEFKWDLADYLAKSAGTIVRSVDDILRTGLYHASLGARLRRRNAAPARETEAYRTALAKRANLTRAMIEAFDRYRVDAFVYPTMREKPALIDEPQAGSTCALSAESGLPALSAPAGLTGDGLPIGLELLGRPFDDARLVSFAFAYEQVARPRTPPSFTPPLVNGHAPPPITFSASSGTGGGRMAEGGTTEADFTWDVTRSALSWDVSVTGVDNDRVTAIVLLRADSASTRGPVILRLAGPGVVATKGEVVLDRIDRDALLDRRLMLATLTREDPAGAGRVRLVMKR